MRLEKPRSKTTTQRRSVLTSVVPRDLASDMKAHTRKNAISGRGAKGNTGKAQSESKVEKQSGTRLKASSLNRPPAPGPVSGPRSSASAGRTQKPGVKPPPDSGTGAVLEIRLGKPTRRAAVRFPIVGIGASAGGLEAC